MEGFLLRCRFVAVLFESQPFELWDLRKAVNPQRRSPLPHTLPSHPPCPSPAALPASSACHVPLPPPRLQGHTVAPTARAEQCRRRTVPLGDACAIPPPADGPCRLVAHCRRCCRPRSASSRRRRWSGSLPTPRVRGPVVHPSHACCATVLLIASAACVPRPCGTGPARTPPCRIRTGTALARCRIRTGTALARCNALHGTARHGTGMRRALVRSCADLQCELDRTGLRSCASLIALGTHASACLLWHALPKRLRHVRTPVGHASGSAGGWSAAVRR